MIKENQHLLNQLHVISDGVLVFASMMIAYFIRFYVFSGIEGVPFVYYVYLGALAVVLCLISYGMVGLYSSYRAIRFHREAARFLGANILDTMALTSVLFVFRLENMSRWTLVFFFLVSSFLLLGKRAAMRLLLRRYRRMGYNQKHVVLVGDGPMARTYLKRVNVDRNLGYQVDGYVCDGGAWSALPCLGRYDQLEAVLDARVPDEVVVAVSAADECWLPKIISACEKTGTKASVIPFYAAYIPSNPQVDNVDGLPMINLRRVPLDNLGNAFLKRAFDIVGASVLIVVTSPLMLLAAVGVKLSSPGPIIFRQKRVGKNKKEFYMYKFRSMRVNAKEQTGWSRDVDPRKTAFGSFIRKCSIDELPQFFNVLKGDMSLVGPRPEVPHFVEQFKEEIPRYMVKHQVRPGITGWAQVNGLRGDTSIRERIEHDLYYIENWNILFDVKILLMTLFRAVNKEKINV
ncbi:undecaprenyl-phosphate glucose phosphotransferase [uncultured Oscillibacter sp.]|uniref:undecaprenyl-phosphate glucose phosphotransferase n=1 Tax=uncultured Oscillibacter sp. TaxID=876091 RepID=UPI0025E7E5A0|nr:undecaprenyl-phosphate glucose phosphotransferase [uncultured Oscillibacter sp.]